MGPFLFGDRGVAFQVFGKYFSQGVARNGESVLQCKHGGKRNGDEYALITRAIRTPTRRLVRKAVYTPHVILRDDLKEYGRCNYAILDNRMRQNIAERWRFHCPMVSATARFPGILVKIDSNGDDSEGDDQEQSVVTRKSEISASARSV